MEQRIYRRKDLPGRTGLSISQIYQEIKEGTFPAPITLTGSGRFAPKGWPENEIALWEEQRRAARDRAAATSPAPPSSPRGRPKRADGERAV